MRIIISLSNSIKKISLNNFSFKAFYDINETFIFDKIIIRIIIKLNFKNIKNAFKIIIKTLYNLKSKIFENSLKMPKELILLKIKDNLK